MKTHFILAFLPINNTKIFFKIHISTRNPFEFISIYINLLILRQKKLLTI